MKLEYAVKYFSPKSQTFSDSSRATSSDSLTGTDLMGAIGYCQSKAGFGVSAFLAKTGVSNDDRYRTIEQLLSYAQRTAPKLVIKSAGGKLGKCLAVLSRLAFEEYSRSAATTSTCKHCGGKGFNLVQSEVVKYAGHVNSFTGEEVIAPVIETELVNERCQPCKGKGKVTARCRCNGTGRVRDLAESARQGTPVDRECDRCSGRGFKRMPASRAFQAVTLLVPDLTQASWSRNWKPFFEMLVAKCEIEENYADSVFRVMTR